MNANKNVVLNPQTFSSIRCEIVVRSDMESLPPTVSHLLYFVRGCFVPQTMLRIEMALGELLRNAVEHGNLGITGEEKSSACEAETWDLLLDERTRNTKNQVKQIWLKLELTPDLFSCTIRDEGSGFNWQEELARPLSSTDLQLHGRGLLYVRAVFDVVSFNDRGNEVTVTKRTEKVST